ncbi:MAG TPA: polysaccharide biosynthesis tyrosine autokinase [Candidatus Angelobacter sp.]|nr:polysaccharide biosynthesis tyrosine autokinase [Candidatus Angelobacter sp.]
MSKNFELLRRAQGQAEVLPPANLRVEIPQMGRFGYDRPVELPHHEPSDWDRISSVLRKHWRLIIGFAASTFLAVGVVTFMMKPVYEPETRLEIDPPGAEIFSLQGGSAAAADSEYLQTQAQKLKSDQLSLEVIRTLRLDHNPDVVSSATRGSSSDSTPVDENAQELTPAENRALKIFRERLKVSRDSNSRLVTVSFGSYEPRLAALVTNKLIDFFIEDSFRTRHDAIVKSTEWLSKQLDDIRKKMDDSNHALADFQRENGIADTGENRNTVAEEMVDMNRQLTQAEADRIQLQAFLAREKQASPDTLPQVRSNPVVQEMTKKLADVRAELAQSEVIYGKNHPNIKKLQNQAQELEAQIAAQRTAIVSELKTTYAAARAREQMMGAQMKNTAKELNQMAQYNQLKKEAQANSDLYNSLYAKVKEAGIAAASKSSNIRIIDRARVLDSPTRPRRMLNLAMGLLGGLFGGIFLAFVREGLDRRIHTAGDVRKWVGLSGIVVVPAITGWKQKLLPGGEGPGIAARRLLDDPYSLEAEALRGLHASVLSSRSGRTPQVVLVASALPGEGKTSIAVSLAVALAQHSKVCLVDAHLRKPGVERALGFRADHGLGEVLTGSAFAEQVIVSEPNIPNLTIIPAGSTRPDPAIALSSMTMRKLLLDLRQQYDFVVIDSAPALPFADVRIISPMADGIVLVARSGITTREAMARTREILAEAQGAPVLNVVLNGADSRQVDYRYRRYSA